MLNFKISVIAQVMSIWPMEKKKLRIFERTSSVPSLAIVLSHKCTCVNGE